MDAWLTRMFERYGARYVVGCIAFVGAEAMLVLCPVCLFPVAVYTELSPLEFATSVLVVDAIAVSPFAASLWANRRPLRVLMKWSEGRDLALADAARVAAFEINRRVLMVLTALLMPLTPVLIAFPATETGRTSTADWIGLSIGAATGVMVTVLAAYFTLELLLRPIRTAVGYVACAEIRPTRLTRRLLTTIMAMTYAAPNFVAYLIVDRDSEGAELLLIVFALALLVAVLSAMLLVPLVMSGVRNPLADLTRATRRVADGDLHTAVPVTTTDELGELAAGFNTMVSELRTSQARIVAAADAARRQVERDLHDGAQQDLVTLRLRLAMVERALGRGDPEAPALLAEARADLDRAMRELRDLAHGIYPALLESDGLRGALAQAVDRTAIPTRLNWDGARRYAPELEAAIYFCCLEALQNAAKHAGEGAAAIVSIADDDDELHFEVRDDGRGSRELAATGSTGLQNMRDRIGALGGKLAVESAPGQGTRVAGSIPLNRSEPSHARRDV